MQQQQPSADPPRPSGRLKWLVAVLAATLIVLAIGVVLSWRVLTRWEPGQSAWERLPPDAKWAVEGHDMRRLLDRGRSDPGLRRLLRQGAEHLDGIGGRAEEESFAEHFDKFMAAYGGLSFAYTAAAPNIMLVGRGEHGLFVILRPPFWLGATLKSDAGVAYSSDMRGYFAPRDGWVIASDAEEQIRDVMEHWNDGACPFGPAPGEAGACLMIGVAGEAGKKTPPPPAAPEAPPPESGLLVFANPFAPFAGAGDDGSGLPETPEPSRPALELLIKPTAAGWELFGRTGGGAGRVADAVASRLPEALPPGVSVPDRDVEAAVTLSGEIRETLLAPLLELTDFPAVAAGPLVAGRSWLRDLWLRRMGTGLTLLAGQPAAPGRGYAPVPRAAAGWNWNVERAAPDFIRGLTDWLDAIRRPDGNALADAVRSAIRYETIDTPGGAAVTVDLPAPVVSGARLTWRAGDGVLGWLSSDPSALPDAKEEEALLLRTVPEAEPGGANCRAAWGLSRAFHDSLSSFLADRWRSLPSSWRDDSADLPVIMRFTDLFFTAYPHGALSARLESDGASTLFHAAVRREESHQAGEGSR